MPVIRRLLPVAAAVALASCGAASAAEAPNVVTSIKPVHSLVAGVMDGVGTPHLIVDGGQSPHTYAMRPSDAAALADADLVFWIGEAFEPFLEGPIENAGSDITSVELTDAPGLTLYDFEDSEDDHGAEHTEHEHHGEEHAEAEHGHDHDEAHDHEHADEAGHDHGHAHTGVDGHIWLDPENAREMVTAIASALSEADPAHADAYQANAEKLDARLAELASDVATRLEPHRDVAYFTFHESFRYFSKRFGLNSKGAITVSPERQPGAARLQEIRAEIGGEDRVCIFAEPQFPPSLVQTIVEGTGAQTGVVDPLGAEIADGPELYFELIDSNAEAFAGCFAATM